MGFISLYFKFKRKNNGINYFRFCQDHNKQLIHITQKHFKWTISK